MDAIKKKMEKLSNETASAEARIAHFEDIKAANELEAEKFEEQLRNIQKKMQVFIIIISTIIIISISISNIISSNTTILISIITIIIITINIFNTILMQAMESAFDVCMEDLFNQTVKLEEMEKKAGNAEGEVSSLR